ncbi:Cerato-platanin [Microdochium nivale]|nr:Cerato-platanin [Microdochium nivale]
MQSSFLLALAAVPAITGSVIPEHSRRAGGAISITPHDLYSSSVGVLGCRIDTNRVAYWPSAVSCDNLCVRVTANGRSVTLLKIDQSGGAFDVSYDAYNYLVTGKSAREEPVFGGPIAAVYEDVLMSECAGLLLLDAGSKGGKLPLAAANAMNFVSSCTGRDTWVGRNFSLYKIADMGCKYGIDEVCTLPDPLLGNQPVCPGELGAVDKYVGRPVVNFAYGTGLELDADGVRIEPPE